MTKRGGETDFPSSALFSNILRSARTGPGPGQELATSSDISTLFPGIQPSPWAIMCCLPGAQAGSWIGCAVASTSSQELQFGMLVFQQDA